MRLAKHAFLIALVTLAMVFAVSAQTLRSPDDTRNIAPTVGTGGPTGGPTGLFTIYDGQTLRKGEYTFSIAYSNFDRDPGNADFTEVPVSFQIGLSDGLELFFNTDAYRGIKVNNPQNLSSFYLPNSQLVVGTVPGAIVLAPGTTGAFANTAVFRPAGAPFVQFPYSGGAVGLYGQTLAPGALFGTTTLGPVRAGGAADNFPGVGSPFGSILPGVVLQTATIAATGANRAQTTPVVYSLAPSYLPDAPFINRRYGQTAFSTYNAGAKWRFTGPTNPFGLGVMAFYRWYADNAADGAGFNQLQRGASAGGNRGDIGATLFADLRAAKWANISGNVGYVYNSSVKGEFPNGTFTLLDRPDELQYGVGVDFPVNQYFQPMAEFRQTRYMGGRTPNVFENDPMDILGGVRIYPRRWFGFGFAYRYHANSQDEVENSSFTQTTRLVNSLTGGTVSTVTSSGDLANVFRTSTDPHGFIMQFWAGRRNARGAAPIENKPADVSALELDQETFILPCPAGTKPKEGSCADTKSIGVKTSATDAENDTLTFNYTVSGGRIVGSGSGVNWDLSGVKPGTYTITSAVDDGCGFCGKTQTKTITVKECADCVPVCNCADSFTVTGPSGITAVGDSMTFTANLVGGSQAPTGYTWTVSGGTISSGQGTPSITVATDASMAGQTVTATAMAEGLCPDCKNDASATGEVAPTPPPATARKIDDLGPAVPDDIKQRLDSLRIELNNDPTARGFIVNTGSAKERAKRNKDLKSAMTFLGIDQSRVTVEDRGGSSPVNSEIWIVPAGAPNP